MPIFKGFRYSFAMNTPLPPDIHQQFTSLQREMISQFQTVWADPLQPRVVVVVPSITLDEALSAHITGDIYYEERLLCLLMLLRQPRTQLVYVTSLPIDPTIVDYYLHLLPGVPGRHARERLTLISCHDMSPRALSSKILERPRVIERIRQAIPVNVPAHLTCYNVTPLEAALSVKLGIPLYGCDPELLALGSKSGSRRIFREVDVVMPDGAEDLQTEDDICQAIVALKHRRPELRKIVVKLNEGFSGQGNATFSLADAPLDETLLPWVQQELPKRLSFVDPQCTYPFFLEQLAHMQGIVEAFIDGSIKRSPSVQCRIDPLGEVSIISTHDQVLDEETGQEFLGCQFPAQADYSQPLAKAGQRVAERLRDQGVLGRFGIDFMSVLEPDGWQHYAIEINLRKGGTTHPFLFLQFLTDGHYNADTGLYEMPNGEVRYYFASDNLVKPQYKGLTPTDLLEILVLHGLHYDSTVQEGVVFYLISALSEFGKLGVVSIGRTAGRAYQLYEQTVKVLDSETA